MNVQRRNLCKKVLVLSGLAASLALAGCGDEEATETAPTGSTGPATCNGDVCILSGTLTEDLTLTADKQWLLRGGVFVGVDGAETPTLTIEPGTTIYGESATNGMLVINRGAKIMAEGTKDAPIVFTSSKEEGNRARGDWGGLVINGNATINACSDDAAAGCEALGEGGTGWYGADNDDDSSGVLRYVRVEFAGRIVSPDNELNGIAFQAVGSGTTIEYIQVHMNKDDGIEFFGGAAQAKYVLVTGAADDSFDWTDGWRGKGQFWVAQQYADGGDNGIEADNNGEDNTATPRSNPTLSNITLIGSPNSDASDIGVLLREGTGVNLSNTVVTGFNESCLNIDHEETFNNAAAGDLNITSSIVSCGTNFGEEDDDPMSVSEFFTNSDDNEAADPGLVSPFDEAAPNFAPAAGAEAAGGARVPSDSFFDQVDFRGGVDPANDWTSGWTTHVKN